jgi:hypothetical protein
MLSGAGPEGRIVGVDVALDQLRAVVADRERKATAARLCGKGRRHGCSAEPAPARRAPHLHIQNESLLLEHVREAAA